MGILNARRRPFHVAAPIMLAALLAGCGSNVSGTAAPGEMDVRKLDVGQYSTEPLDVRSDYSHEIIYGKELAVGRLGDAVVSGPDVDPMFGYSAPMETLTGSYSSGSLAPATVPALQQNNMQFAFSASATSQPLPAKFVSGGSGYSPLGAATANADATSFNVTLMQFPDQRSAQAAAEQTEAADFAVAPDQNAKVTLDKYPNAKAHWRPGIPSMSANLASGQYVVVIFVQQPKPELNGLKDLAEKVFAAQLPLIEKLPPLSPREILRLDYDPDGMIRRTLHPKSSYPYPDAKDEITRTPRGYLHVAQDQTAWKNMLDANGIDRISDAKNGALVFRARDSAAATGLWSGIKALTPGSDDKQMDVPGVSCAEVPKANPNDRTAWSMDAWNYQTRFVCTLHYDRYVAQVASSQLADAHLRAAAQYALLANSQFM